jgi:mannosyltransferase PIG-V
MGDTDVADTPEAAASSDLTGTGPATVDGVAGSGARAVVTVEARPSRAPDVRADRGRVRVGPVQVTVFWLVSRMLLMLTVATVVTMRQAGGESPTGSGFDRILGYFSAWDSLHYLRIADAGYLPADVPCCDQAFFPGYPFAIRYFAAFTGVSLPLAGIVLSVLAGSVAAGLMCYLGSITTGDERVGVNAALFLAVAPYGVFFSVVYTESIFLMFCLGAWVAATRRHWWLAGALAAGATSVRINGLFLLGGLAVMYLIQLRAEGRLTFGPLRSGESGPRWAWRLRQARTWRVRPRRDVLALSLPLLPVVAYFTWLHHRTGSWHAWSEAQIQGWGRHTAAPWTGLRAGVMRMVEPSSWYEQLSAAADLVAIGCGVALIVALVRWRRWPEVAYMVPSILVLVCSTMVVSSIRYALVWFPGFLLLAELSVRPDRRWLRLTVVAVGLPLLVLLTYLFAKHYWVA